MKPPRFFSLLVLGIFIAASIVVPRPQTVHAQTCTDPTGMPIPCPDKNKKKKSTSIPPRPTSTPTATIVFQPQSTGQGGTLIPFATETPTLTSTPPWYATWVWCQNYAEATMIATLGHDDVPNGPGTPDWHATAVAPCDKYKATATPFVIPPVAGPVFVPPGVKNALILVLLIGALAGGVFLILRGSKPPNPNKKQ